MTLFGGLFGGGSPPKYNMSPEYKGMTLGTAYPKVTEGIKAGGFGLDTAGLERTTRENIASNYGGAYDKVRSFTSPYDGAQKKGGPGLNRTPPLSHETVPCLMCHPGEPACRHSPPPVRNASRASRRPVGAFPDPSV